MINTKAIAPPTPEEGWVKRLGDIGQTPIFYPVVSTIAFTIFGFVMLAFFGGTYNSSLFVIGLIFGLITLSMVPQLGLAHQLAFSQSVFMAFGAYGVAVLNTKYGWPVVGAIAACTVAGGVIGAILGWPVTKVPGFALALATLFFSVIVGSFIIFSSYLGGSTGLGGIAPMWPGADFTSTLIHNVIIVVLLAAVTFFLCGRVIKSGIGLELALLGVNEGMAASIGVITSRRKLEVFIFGCVFATLAGAVFAATQNFVSSTTFSQTAQLNVLIMLFVGGRASLWGAMIGALGIEYLSGLNNFVATNLQIFEGVLITVVLLFAPGGFIDILRRSGAFSLRRLQALSAKGKKDTRTIVLDAELGTELEGEAVAAPGTFGAEEGELTAALDATELADARQQLHHDLAHRGDLASTNNILGDSDEVQLEVDHLLKRFGGLVAVDDVSLTIRGNGIHTICGPNGAGKTTLFELIAGSLPADSGRVVIRGRDATKLLAHQRADLGLARTRQAVRLMPSRSVLDNVAVAALKSHHTFMTRAILHSDLNDAYGQATEALNDLGIAHMAKLRPAQLTLEAQRMVEFARALVAKPQLLMLDEPASGLSTEQRGRLAETLQALAEHMTVVLVEHDLQLVARISKEVFVLIHGRLEFQGGPQEFLNSPIVRSELMGLMTADQTLSSIEAASAR